MEPVDENEEEDDDDNVVGNFVVGQPLHVDLEISNNNALVTYSKVTNDNFLQISLPSS